MTVIAVSNLHKQYHNQQVLRGVEFTVSKGQIFGLLGANGAGKTTLMEILIGLRQADSGRVHVLGYDPAHEADVLQREVGIQLQHTSLFPRVTVQEALDLFQTFYDTVFDAPYWLKTLELDHKRDSQFDKLSGGEQQRLALCLALINDPQILFLDEISSGVDPVGRRRLWAIFKELQAAGKTIFLTTHLMDEAEAICSQVLLLHKGKALEAGHPAGLIEAHGVDNLDDLFVALLSEKSA